VRHVRARVDCNRDVDGNRGRGWIFACACFVFGLVRWIPCELSPYHNFCLGVPSICLCITKTGFCVGMRRYIVSGNVRVSSSRFLADTLLDSIELDLRLKSNVDLREETMDVTVERESDGAAKEAV